MIPTLLWASLLSALLIGLGASGILLARWSESHHICRTGLLEAQQEIGRSIKELLALNPEAARLAAEKIEAERIMAVEPNPVTAANLIRIEAQQAALAIRQRSVIARGKMRASWRLLRTKNELARLTDERSFDSVKAAVRPIDPTSLASEYELEPDFANAQRFGARWTGRSKTLIGRCFATLEPATGGRPWKSVLSRD